MPKATRANVKSIIRKKAPYSRETTRKYDLPFFRLQKQMPVGFPKTNMVKLRYVDQITLSPGLSTVGPWVFCANSLYDPSVTGTGHQPSGFDQWSVFYNHYIVVSSKITVSATLLTAGTESGSVGILGITLADDPTSSSNVTTLLEQPTTTHTTLTFNNQSRPAKISKTYSTKKFYNITNVSDNFSRLGSVISSNPTEQAFFNVFVGSGNTSLDPPSVNCLVVIEYLAMFSEPKELAQS